MVFEAVAEEVDVSCCTYEGAGLTTCIAGELTSFTIQTRDAFSNLVASPAAHLQVSVAAGSGDDRVVTAGEQSYGHPKAFESHPIAGSLYSFHILNSQ